MEEEEIADPLDINKDANVIKEAQNDIGKLDVLVCGKCHDVFHYIQDFQEHQDKCDEISEIRGLCKNEPKAQIWAFMLWKNAQFRKNKENEEDSSNSGWSIYQKWCKLDINQKNSWIQAADYIQNNTKIATARLQEIRTKPLFSDKKKLKNYGSPSTKKDDESFEEGEIHLEEEVERELARIHGETETPRGEKKTFKPVQLNSDVTIFPSRSSKKALRTNLNKQDKPEEYAVEKILSKRFNPRRRTFEYFIKWENFDSSQNTWEPASHLSSCKAMVEEFEESLRKQKAAKVAKAAADRKSASFSDIIERTAGGRPQRTSKQKALKQVKTWCGDISEGDEGSGKRKSFSDDDSSDSFEKRMREGESDTSEDEKQGFTIRKMAPKSSGSYNGFPKKNETTISPETKIIRLNEKQLPGLSSGVYVMSKTEGIIKLDSNSSVKGNTLISKIGDTRIKVVKKEDGTVSNVVKVTPNLVQKVHRNVVKRDTMPMKQSATGKSTVTVSTIKRGEAGIKMNIIEKPAHNSDDESDGIEELEFPSEIPIPEPESPPGEFTLDPMTGKLFGQKTPTPPPTPTPEQEISRNVVSAETSAKSESPSLDNLVKLAAADLTEEDLKVDDGSSVVSTANTSAATAIVLDESLNLESGQTLLSADGSTKILTSSDSVGTLVVQANPTDGAMIVSEIVRENTSKAPKSQIYSIVPNSVSGSSILSTALRNSNIKESRSSPPSAKRYGNTPNTMRQKMTSIPTVQHHQRTTTVPSYAGRSGTPKASPGVTYIQRVTPGRGRGSRTYVQRNVTSSSASPQEPYFKRSNNVATYRNTTRGHGNVPRKIGHTTIYRTTPVMQNVAQVVKSDDTIVINASDLQEDGGHIHAQIIGQESMSSNQATVISMPLLTDEESNQAELASAVQMASTTDAANAAETTASATVSEDASGNALMDVSSFSLTEGETPILITGEDGTIYQVAGQNEDGQTVLITQGPDGQQQCVLVATDDSLTEETQQTLPVTEITEDESNSVQSPLVVNTDDSETAQVVEAMESSDADESQVVAQIVKADPPSPGGTRKVVLMLPDGNLMMTDVTAEQYAALELDK